MIYKIGDRVTNIKSTVGIPKGMSGTVAEYSDCPWVAWDNGEVLCREDKYLKLLEAAHVG
jgi:hypothetical protein